MWIHTASKAGSQTVLSDPTPRMRVFQQYFDGFNVQARIEHNFIPILRRINRGLDGLPVRTSPKGDGKEGAGQSGGSVETLHWAPPMHETLEVFIWCGTEVVPEPVQNGLCGQIQRKYLNNPQSQTKLRA